MSFLILSFDYVAEQLFLLIIILLLLRYYNYSFNLCLYIIGFTVHKGIFLIYFTIQPDLFFS